MTNKPMLSVERELLELVTDNKHIDKESISIRRWEALCKLRAILSKPAAQHQCEPVAESSLTFHFLHPLTKDRRVVTLTKAQVAEGMEGTLYEQLNKVICACEPVGETNVVDCNCWEYTDDFDLVEVPAEQPAPAADHPQCEECKGWGYHENHYEGGGTECGACGGSGNATVVMVMPDRMEVEPFTTIDRGSKNYKAGYNAALAEVARLNEAKT